MHLSILLLYAHVHPVHAALVHTCTGSVIIVTPVLLCYVVLLGG